jgi:hypothetical protein
MRSNHSTYTPFFPRLRSDHRLVLEPSPQKQFLSNQSIPVPPFPQGVCLAGLVLASAGGFDQFYRFFAMIAVIIEGVVERIKLFEGDHRQQGVPQ